MKQSVRLGGSYRVGEDGKPQRQAHTAPASARKPAVEPAEGGADTTAARPAPRKPSKKD